MTVNVKMDSTTHTLLEDSDFFDKMYDYLFPIGSIRIISTNRLSTEKDPILAKEGTTWYRGIAQIKSRKNSNWVLDIAGGSISDGANVDIYSNNRSYAQQWYIDLIRDGYTSSTAEIGGFDIFVRVA